MKKKDSMDALMEKTLMEVARKELKRVAKKHGIKEFHCTFDISTPKGICKLIAAMES